MIYETLYSKNTKKWSLKKNAREKSKCIGRKAESIIELDLLGMNVPQSIFLDYSIFDYYLSKKQPPDELKEHFLHENLIGNVAIRSSSSIEDGRGNAYAGFFLTKLNVAVQYEEVEQKIIECYHSINKLTTINKHLKRYVKMGIIIQKMIIPEFSGVVFSISPENADDNIIQLEYCNGYGDRLTHGLVISSSLKIDKSDLKIITQKGISLLPNALRDEICSKAKLIENYFSFPQDIEFVTEQETQKIFFLQSRPITAFNFTPEYIIQYENKKLGHIFQTGNEKYNCDPILSVNNIAELFTEAIPFGYSVFQYIFAGSADIDGAYNLGRKRLGYATIPTNVLRNLYTTVGNKARVNLQIDALVYRLYSIDENYYREHFLKNYMSKLKSDIEKCNYPQNEVYIQSPSLKECIEIFSEEGAEIYAKYSDFLFTLSRQTIPHLKHDFQSIIDDNNSYYNLIRNSFIECDTGALSLRQDIKENAILSMIVKIIDNLRQRLGVQYVIYARIAFLSNYIIRAILEKLLIFKPEVFDLKIELHPHDEIVEYYVNLFLKHEINKQCKSSENDIQNSDLKYFRKKHGHLGPLDLSQPRLGEYTDEDLNDLIEHSTLQTDQNNEIETDWVNQFKNWYKVHENDFHLEMRFFFEWLENANSFSGYRETLKSELLKILYIVKLLINELSQKYQLYDLIHYLTFDEIQQLNNETLNFFRFKALKMKVYFRSCGQIEIDRYLFNGNPANIKIVEKKTDQPGVYRSIKGDTIIHGKAEGICLVADSAFDFHKKISEYKKSDINNIIGVFKSVEPAYQNINYLSGIITEFGGQLAHAATICREYNIPYISGISTSSVKDGNYIIFDTINQQIIIRD